MNNLMKLQFGMFGVKLTVMIVMTVLMLIKGWGLTPQNWWWIIGPLTFGYIFSLIVVEIRRRN